MMMTILSLSKKTNMSFIARLLQIAALSLGAAFFAVAGEGQTSTLKVEDLRRFAEVFNAVKENFVEPVDSKTLFEGAIRGMLERLDDSAYLDKKAFDELQRGSQTMAGVGLEIGFKDGLLTVVRAIEDAPAAQGGVKAGDVIREIDGVELKGMALQDITGLLRGKPGTTVSLTVLRRDESKPLSFALQRKVIRVQSVRSKWLDNGYAHIRLSQFQHDTLSSLALHLKSLYKQGAVKGLLLDLRGNQGGLLLAGIGVAGVFLPSDSIVVSIDSRVEQDRRTYRATPKDYSRRGDRLGYLDDIPPEIKTVPLVVLVNGKSAAASEIVAGALQDHERALIVGTSTFGRASIQTILPLPNSTAVKLTTGRWTTPKGKSVAGKGVAPDVVLEENPTEDNQGVLQSDHQLKRALDLVKTLRER